ncbi:MAG: sugar transferase [Pseudomonadota bacterium]
MSTHFRNVNDLKSVEAINMNAKLPGASTSLYRAGGKRLLDLTIVLLAAPFAIVLVGLMVLANLFEGQSPFYIQKRVGFGGRGFGMLKMRTMVANADDALQAYLAANPAAREEWETKQKLENDPRITRFGRFMRMTSLDELPQLWNVFLGDMSIVGPRPIIVGQEHLYPGRAYYMLQPGLTGSWQISDRSQGTFAGRAAFDNDYQVKLSFRYDLEIILKTVGAVARLTGR